MSDDAELTQPPAAPTSRRGIRKGKRAPSAVSDEQFVEDARLELHEQLKNHKVPVKDLITIVVQGQKIEEMRLRLELMKKPSKGGGDEKEGLNRLRAAGRRALGRHGLVPVPRGARMPADEEEGEDDDEIVAGAAALEEAATS